MHHEGHVERIYCYSYSIAHADEEPRLICCSSSYKPRIIHLHEGYILPLTRLYIERISFYGLYYLSRGTNPCTAHIVISQNISAELMMTIVRLYRTDDDLLMMRASSRTTYARRMKNNHHDMDESP